MLNIDLRPGESIQIGDFAVVTLVQKSGSKARLSVDADKSIGVDKLSNAATSKVAATFGINNKETI